MTFRARQVHPAVRVAVDGQSLCRPVGATPGAEWPIRVMSGRGIPLANVAVSGAGWTNLTNGTGFAIGQPASTRLLPIPQWSEASGLVLFGGQADLQSGASAATVMSWIVAYGDAARTAGFDYVIACTVPPAYIFTSGLETARQAFNGLLLADAGSDFDAKVDIASVPQLDDSTDTTYYSDGLHFTNEGHAIAGDTIEPAVDDMIAALLA
jgi:hypothetical protein